MAHDVEVDQSGRTDRLTEDTVVAFSDGIQRSVLLTARTKRECYKQLREQHLPKRVVGVRLFAAALVILFKDQAKELSVICVDLEYPGWEGEILRHLFRRVKWLRKDQIYFDRIGKKSRAHDLALKTWRRKQKADKQISIEELLKAC